MIERFRPHLKLTINRPDLTFKKPARTVFVHTDAPYAIEGEEQLDLILSPAFYWCKKERVGVKNSASARKIAQSVFDGNIPGGEYRYFVHKTDEPGVFLFFAYDEDRIVERLRELNIPLPRVRSVRFAQSEFAEEGIPLAVSEKTVLLVTDGIVSVMPRHFVTEAEPMELENRRLSRRKINIRTYNSLGFKASRIHTLSAALFLFAILFGIEGHYYQNAVETEAARGSSMLHDAALPTTSFQLESIKKNLRKRADEVRELQQMMEKSAAVAKGKATRIEKLKMDDKTLKVTYTSSDTKTVQARIKQAYPKAKLSQGSGTVTMELTR